VRKDDGGDEDISTLEEKRGRDRMWWKRGGAVEVKKRIEGRGRIELKWGTEIVLEADRLPSKG